MSATSDPPQQPDGPDPAVHRAAAGRSRAVLAGLLGLALVLGFWHRFVLDDAFISFQYARHLVEGHGLTWYGNRVEGYTNFLWTLWIALGLALGADPVPWSMASGIGAFLVATFALWRLAVLVLSSRFAAAVAALLFATNFSVASFATSGLETMLQTALLCLTAALVYDMWAAGSASAGGCAAFSFASAAAVLTRPDSAIVVMVLLGTLATGLPRRAWTRRAVALLVAPAAILLGAWLVWKAGFYHSLLPNTFHVKVGGRPGMLWNGFRYIVRFFSEYLLWPFVGAGTVVHVVRRLALPPRIAGLLALVATWCFYVVAVGGDFMEFRFMVPVAPFLFVLLVYAIHEVLGRGLIRRPRWALTLSALLVVGASAHHGSRFQGTTPDRTLDSIPALASFYGLYPDGDWGRIGRPMRQQLGDLDPLIASHAVGAIPWHSRLRTLDLYGLNEPDIRDRGLPAPPWSFRPGHQRMLPLAYLRERRVNLILGHPTLIPRGGLHRRESVRLTAEWLQACVGFDRAPAGRVDVVAMPLDEDWALLLWYLTPTPELDRRIIERGWETARFGM